MFTGLIEGVGKVKGLIKSGEDLVLIISPRFEISDCRIGDSIAVDGVCLTVTEMKSGSLSMYASKETLSISSLEHLRQGDEVNLERALRFSDRLGGHIVSGHVDGVGQILTKEKRERSWFIQVGIDEGLSRYIIKKGSIAVDGISLTINDCNDTYFEVNIIPQTGQETTLLKKSVGDQVNIETDIIGKYVERFFTRERRKPKGKDSSAIDRQLLRKHGFSVD
jgi:riboflavin synthase